jgi:hypothetical protein
MRRGNATAKLAFVFQTSVHHGWTLQQALENNREFVLARMAVQGSSQNLRRDRVLHDREPPFENAARNLVDRSETRERSIEPYPGPTMNG